MTLLDFYKLDAELVDYFTSDEGYRIEQHSAIIDGIYKSIFMCNGKIKIISAWAATYKLFKVKYTRSGDKR